MLNLLSSRLAELAILLGVLGRAIAAPATYEILPLNAPNSSLGVIPNVATESPTQVILPPQSRPFNSDGITDDNVFDVITALIACESNGRRGAINPKDVDGRPKYGELQYDLRTWDWFEKKFNFEGDPMIRKDAITMTRLALLAGMGKHWGCFSKAKP